MEAMKQSLLDQYEYFVMQKDLKDVKV